MTPKLPFEYLRPVPYFRVAFSQVVVKDYLQKPTVKACIYAKPIKKTAFSAANKLPYTTLF